MIDDDDSAYVAYGAWSNDHTISIEKLNDDYLDSDPATNTGLISESSHEAPLLFKRKGRIIY